MRPSLGAPYVPVMAHPGFAYQPPLPFGFYPAPPPMMAAYPPPPMMAPRPHTLAPSHALPLQQAAPPPMPMAPLVGQTSTQSVRDPLMIHIDLSSSSHALPAFGDEVPRNLHAGRLEGLPFGITPTQVNEIFVHHNIYPASVQYEEKEASKKGKPTVKRIFHVFFRCALSCSSLKFSTPFAINIVSM